MITCDIDWSLGNQTVLRRDAHRGYRRWQGRLNLIANHLTAKWEHYRFTDPSLAHRYAKAMLRAYLLTPYGFAGPAITRYDVNLERYFQADRAIRLGAVRRPVESVYNPDIFRSSLSPYPHDHTLESILEAAL